MSGSYTLAQRLKNPYSVTIDGRGPLGGWEDAYMINGGHRECHPDFIATPIGPDPNGFLVCQRKKTVGGNGFETNIKPKLFSHAKEGISHNDPSKMYTQTYNLYSDVPNTKPNISPNGGQSLKFEDRRLPFQAHLQGAGYFRDATKFRGIGTEKIDALPGEFGYKENKYYFSAPPPLYDVTQGVQPYELWRREQIRMGNFSEKSMQEFEKEHTYIRKSSTF
jgi:hypothetical protein